MKPQGLARAFNRNVKTLEARTARFLEMSDPANTQALRRATARLRTSYSVLPKRVRKSRRARDYLDAARKLSRATGKLRDIDTIAAWTSSVSDTRDRKAFGSDLTKMREAHLKKAVRAAKKLSKGRLPWIDADRLSLSKVSRRVSRVQGLLSKRVDKEFEGFLETQDVELMHSLRKDSKRLRHLIELTRDGGTPLLERLRSIQDNLGAIRDHDLVIEYLRGRIKLTSSPSLVREEIARRHARLEDFVSKNRGRGRVVPIVEKVKTPVRAK
jgi:CHAD domain-containing protein